MISEISFTGSGLSKEIEVSPYPCIGFDPISKLKTALKVYYKSKCLYTPHKDQHSMKSKCWNLIADQFFGSRSGFSYDLPAATIRLNFLDERQYTHRR
jgi:hypothetical protein